MRNQFTNHRINLAQAITLALAGVAAWAGIVAAPHECLANVYQKQWIANNTGQTANDLELTFSGPITNVKNSGNPGAGGTTTANAADDYTITGISINSGTELQLRWGASDNVKPPPTIVDPSYWTKDGTNIGNVTLMGTPAKITYNQYTAYATFTNDSATDTLDYTNVALYVDNTAANFTLDSFDTPTGTNVPVSSSFALGPGQSETLSFGTVNPAGYELALASIAVSTDPSTTLDVGSATAVPEPASLTLLAIGSLGMLMLRKRKAA